MGGNTTYYAIITIANKDEAEALLGSAIIGANIVQAATGGKDKFTAMQEAAGAFFKGIPGFEKGWEGVRQQLKKLARTVADRGDETDLTDQQEALITRAFGR